MDTKWKKKRENFEGKPTKKSKIENIKNIPLFENIYEKNPLSFNETTIIEGYTDQEQCSIDLAVEAETQNIESRLNSSHITTASLSQGIMDSLEVINDINTGSFEESSVINNGMNSTSPSTTSTTVSSIDTKSISLELKIAITNFLNIISTFFARILSVFTLISQYIQYFILNYHIYYTQLMTNIASGLTGGHTTKTELSIFMAESQKMITLLLIWVFIYNWYYVVFFLDKEYKWTFDADQLKRYGIAYMLFAPSVKAVQIANNCLVTYPAKLTKYLSKGMIFVLLLIIFWILVSANFQSSLIYDFFASLSYLKFFKSTQMNKTPSMVTIFVMMIVLYYGIKHFFTGTITSYCFDLLSSGGTFGFVMGLVTLVLTFCIYLVYLIMVNVPLGVVLLFTYLLGYTFFAILGYEGFNSFTMITAISEDISMVYIQPEGTAFDNLNNFTWANAPSWIYQKCKNGCSMILKYIFEILIILSLVGGISTYILNYKSILVEKSALHHIGNTSGVARAAFRNLFTWLILINILIIIILSIVIQQKVKFFNSTHSEVNKKIKMNAVTVPRNIPVNVNDYNLNIMQNEQNIANLQNIQGLPTITNELTNNINPNQSLRNINQSATLTQPYEPLRNINQSATLTQPHEPLRNINQSATLTQPHEPIRNINQSATNEPINQINNKTLNNEVPVQSNSRKTTFTSNIGSAAGGVLGTIGSGLNMALMGV